MLTFAPVSRNNHKAPESVACSSVLSKRPLHALRPARHSWSSVSCFNNPNVSNGARIGDGRGEPRGCIVDLWEVEAGLGGCRYVVLRLGGRWRDVRCVCGVWCVVVRVNGGVKERGRFVKAVSE